MTNKDLYPLIKSLGEIYPKKHGEWYRLHVHDDNYLVYDTWNGDIYHYSNGAKPSDTDNMYNCVYVFYDNNGKVENYNKIKGTDINFWYDKIHQCLLTIETNTYLDGRL